MLTLVVVATALSATDASGAYFGAASYRHCAGTTPVS